MHWTLATAHTVNTPNIASPVIVAFLVGVIIGLLLSAWARHR